MKKKVLAILLPTLIIGALVIYNVNNIKTYKSTIREIQNVHENEKSNLLKQIEDLRNANANQKDLAQKLDNTQKELDLIRNVTYAELQTNIKTLDEIVSNDKTNSQITLEYKNARVAFNKLDPTNINDLLDYSKTIKSYLAKMK